MSEEELFAQLPSPTVWQRSAIPEECLRELIKDDLVEEVKGEPFRMGMTKVFLTEEYSKKRYRVVCDCLGANIAAKNADDVRFTPLQALKQKLGEVQCLITFDLKAFYFQFSVPEKMRRWFTFMTKDGRAFVWKRLAMGYKNATAIAQETVTEWLRVALELAGIEKSSVVSDVYIDNLIVGGELSVIERLRTELTNVAARWNMTIGEAAAPSVAATHRGVTFNVSENKLTMSPKFVEKSLGTAPKGKMPWSNWRKAIARALYAFEVLGSHKCDFFDLIVWYRANALTHPSKPISPPMVVQHQFSTYLENVLRSQAQLKITVARVTTICTDATTNTASAIILDASAATIVTQPVKCPFIAAAELAAVAMAVEMVQKTRVRVFTDNSVALWCLQRMFSASPPLNGILRKIAAHMREKDVSLEAVLYVPSRLNPAIISLIWSVLLGVPALSIRLHDPSFAVLLSCL